MDEHIIILGGGISGLSAGHELVSRGFKVTILETSGQVGGLAGTVREGPYFLDYGPHSFFSDDTEIRDLVLNLFDPPPQAKPRSSRFLFQGRYLDYPLTAAGVLFQMGPGAGLKAAWSFISNNFFSRQKKSGMNQEMTVEEWAVSNFGPYLYQTFFKPYTEQFWKIPASQLSSNSIPSSTRTGFIQALKLLLTQKNTWKNPTQIERETLPTYYPASGYGEIPEQMAARFVQKSGSLKTSCRVTQIQRLSNQYEVHYLGPEGTGKIQGSHVISTLPLCLLMPMIHPRPAKDIIASAGALDYRPLVNLGMVLERQQVLPCAYFYTLDRPYNRLSEMNQFSSFTSPEHQNIIAAEIPCLRDETLWNASKEALFDRCIDSLEKDSILKRHEVKQLILAKAAYAYPIYRTGYKKHLERVMNFIKDSPKFYTLGRSGEFRYMDLDQCVRRAIDLSRKIISELSSQAPLQEEIISYRS